MSVDPLATRAAEERDTIMKQAGIDRRLVLFVAEALAESAGVGPGNGGCLMKARVAVAAILVAPDDLRSGLSIALSSPRDIDLESVGHRRPA